MPDVVSEPGHVDEVGVAAQPDRHPAADLCDLQRVRQPGARGVALTRPDHLRLVGESTQRRAVQHPGPVAGEVGAVFGLRARQRGTLRRFDHQALPVELVVCVAVHHHRRTVCQDSSPVPTVPAGQRTTLTIMRIARLLSLVLAILAAGFLLPGYVTDASKVLSGAQVDDVEQAVDKLYTDRRARLWVVYVDSFDGLDAETWAERTRKASDLDAGDAILAVATRDRSYQFLVPTEIVSDSASDDIRRNAIEPKLRGNDWAGAAVAAAEGLNSASAPGPGVSGFGVLVAGASLVVLVLLLWWWTRRRRRKRREAEFAAARRVDPSDPNALAAV